MARLSRISHRTPTSLALVAATFLAVAGAPAPAEASSGPTPWNQFQGGPGHSGSLADGPVPPYRLAWRFPAPPGGVSGAVIWGDLAIAVGERAVYGIDLATGHQRWTLTRNGGPLALPAVGSDGTRPILVFTDDSTALGASLVGVDLASLREIWRAALKSAGRGGVTIDGSGAFVGDTSGNVYAVDLSTGRLRWTVKGIGPIEGPPAVAGSRVVVVARDTSTPRVQVLAVDEADGRKLWEYIPRVSGTAASVPAAGDRTVLVGFDDRAVRAIDAATGAERWGSLANSPFSPVSSPAVDGGDVYLADFSGGLYRLNAGTGDRAWDYQFNDRVVRSSPVVSGSSVVLGLGDGRLVAVDARTGNLVWQGSPSPGLIGSIALSAQMLVAVKGGRRGGLVAYEHDPRGRLIDIPSPSRLELGRLLASYVLSMALVLAMVYLPFRLLAARLGSAAVPAVEAGAGRGEDGDGADDDGLGDDRDDSDGGDGDEGAGGGGEGRP